MDARSHIEILYHFSLEYINLLISLREKLDRKKPVIEFKGHPEMKRLLLPDEWPEGVYPLRTDYEEWDKNAIRDRGV